MIRTRHGLLACLVVLGVAAQAAANPGVQLNYNDLKGLGDVHIGNGWVDITNGILVVASSGFAFIPDNSEQPAATTGGYGIYGTAGVKETGYNAVHDALVEGLNLHGTSTGKPGGGGYWLGANGIESSTAATNTDGNTTVGWIDNSLPWNQFKTFGSQDLTKLPGWPNQYIFAYDYNGDVDFNAGANGYISQSAYIDAVDAFNGVAPRDGTTADFGSGPQPAYNFDDGDSHLNGSYITQSDYIDTVDNFNNGGLTPLWNGNGFSQAPIVPQQAAVVPVPEPGTLAIVLACAIPAVLLSRRRRPS